MVGLGWLLNNDITVSWMHLGGASCDLTHFSALSATPADRTSLYRPVGLSAWTAHFICAGLAVGFPNLVRGVRCMSEMGIEGLVFSFCSAGRTAFWTRCPISSS